VARPFALVALLDPRFISGFKVVRRLQWRLSEELMGKYLIAWLLGVPASILVLIYLVSHAGCG
jgi:hypothetical protein